MIIKDILFLPSSYKYENLVDLVLNYEEYSQAKMVSFYQEVQPIKLKIKQKELSFLVDFVTQVGLNKDN